MKSLYEVMCESYADHFVKKRCDEPTKMDPKDKEHVLELNEMIDVWRLVDEYDIRWYTDYKKYPRSIFVNKEDWEEARNGCKNPKNFDVCLKSNGTVSGHNGPF